MPRPLSAAQLECLERIAGGKPAMDGIIHGSRAAMVRRLIDDGMITAAHVITKKGQLAVKRAKLPKYWLDLHGRMLRGQLVLCMRHAPDGGDDIYFIEPGGRDVTNAAALRLIAGGYVQPNGDGFFGNDTSQTWRAVE